MAEFTLYYPQKFKGTFNVYGQCYTTLKVQGSDNNSNWVDVTNSLSKTQSIAGYKGTGVNVDEFVISINSPYKYFKIVPLTTYNTNAGGYILRIIDIVFTNTVYETSALNQIIFPMSYTSVNSYGAAFTYIGGSSAIAYISNRTASTISLANVDSNVSSGSYITVGY